MSHALIIIGSTLGSAIGIVLLEAYLTLLSRLTRSGQKFPLGKDDADWWIEWVVAATLALVIFLIINAHEHKPITTIQVVTAIAALVFGYSSLPTIAKVYCLNARGRVVSVKALFALNLSALFILMATVAVGVKIYA